jgi:hypothetical protein
MKKHATLVFALIATNFAFAQSISINSQFVNPCGADANNEFIIARTFAQPLNIADLALGSYDPSTSVNYNYWFYGTNVVTNPYPTFSAATPETCGSTGVSCYTFAYPSITGDNTNINTRITALNTIAGCNVFLPVPSTDIIPANSKFIIFLGGGCADFDNAAANLNFSNHCAGGVPTTQYYFVMAKAGAGCGGGGYFSNSATRTTTLAAFKTGSNTDINNYDVIYQNYNPASVNAGNAGVAALNNSGAVTWIGNQGCVPAANVLLPLSTIVNFNASSKNGFVALNWAVSKHEDGTVFSLEKSLDGTNYQTINEQNSQSQQTTYSYNDRVVNDNRTYYRIRIFNTRTQELAYSNVRVVEHGNKNSFFAKAVLSNQTLNLQIDANQAQTATIKLISGAGQVLLGQQTHINSGINTISFKLSSPAIGIYYCMIELASGERQSIKLIQQ